MAENGLTESYLKTLAQDIREADAACRKSLVSALDNAIKAGGLLFEARDKIPEGEFKQWYEAETGMKKTTVYQYMRLHENRKKFTEVRGADLGIKAAIAFLAAEDSEGENLEPAKEKRETLFEEVARTAPKDANGTPKITATHVEKVAAKRATPTEVKQQAKHDALTAAEQHAKAEQETAPWESFVGAVTACLDRMEAVRDQLNEILDGKKGENKNRHAFAHFIPYLGTIGSIDAAIKCVRENLPGAAHADKPYYIPVRSVKMRAEKVGGR